MKKIIIAVFLGLLATGMRAQNTGGAKIVPVSQAIQKNGFTLQVGIPFLGMNGAKRTTTTADVRFPWDVLYVYPTFAEKSFSVSKGYFGDKVLISWDIENNFSSISRVKIYKRAYSDAGDNTYQFVGSVGPSVTQYEDKSADSGKLFEYKVVAEGVSVTESKYTTYITGFGYRSPTAVVTGRINYDGGVAVPFVKVVAEKTGAATGNALNFNGVDQMVEINPDAKPIAYSDTGFSVSIWAKPAVLSGTQALVFQKGFFQILLKGTKVSVTIAGTNHDSNADLVTDSYSNIFVTCTATELVLYINGKRDSAVPRTGALPTSVSSKICLGSADGIAFYNGLLDEFRIYKTALTATDVERDFGRLIKAETEGIVGNWRFDEGNGPFVFDCSKQGGFYNKIDGVIKNATWSTEVPTKTQLGFAGFSDINGNYIIEGIQYYGAGENFSITPSITLSQAMHAFDPKERILFLGDGSSTENNVDFLDKSSFEVTGFVVFNFEDVKGKTLKTSGSPGVSIWIDGTTKAMRDGKPILTDEFGQFKVSVPIGKHFLEFRKDGHTFESKFPDNKPTFDFQDNLSGIKIFDNTTHKLVGCVVGGLVQGNKKLGFFNFKGSLKPEDQRVNNIGTSYFTLTSKGPGDKIIRRVETDPETGEFEIELPPKEYDFSDIKYLTDDKLIFEAKDILAVNLANSDAYKGIDSELPVFDGTAYVNKKVRFNAERPIPYRSTPSMTVKSNMSTDYLPNTKIGSVEKTTIGETTVKIFDKATNLEVVIPTLALPFPLFLQGKSYQTVIKAIEQYTYVGGTKNGTIDEVPVLDGKVTVSNNISAKAATGSEAAYQKADQTWEVLTGNTHVFDLQNNGSVNYTFVGGDPDLLIGEGDRDSYVKSMSITLRTGDKSIYWPKPEDASTLYKGYVLGGAKLPGADFITAAPVSIQTTLRMPPGSKSSVTIEKGSIFTTEETNSTKGGGDWSFGVGLGFEFEAEVPVVAVKSAHSEGSVMKSTYGSKYLGDEKTSVSTQGLTENFTISSEDAFDKGDFFISTSKNVEIGRATSLKFIPSTVCAGCKGATVKGSDGQQYVMSTGNTYYQKENGKTFFLYSEDHIKNNIIFKLKEIRNGLFEKENGIYQTKLLAGNPNYGLNNDDPRVVTGWTANNENDYTRDDAADDNGNSYTFVRSKKPANDKGIIVDEVRKSNSEIRAWEEILMNNEIEKYAAISKGNPEKKNVSISSGIAYTNTSTVESEEIRLESSEVMAGASLDIEASILVGAGLLIGPKLNSHGGDDKTVGWSKTHTDSKAVTTSYTIQDNDPYNTLSVNVYKGKGNDSPIFEIVGGQTSCPFEREKELEVTKTHLYYLKYWVEKIPGIIEDRTRIINDKYLNQPLLNAQRDEEIAKISAILNEKKWLYETLIALYNNTKKPLLGARTVQIQKPGILVNGNDKATMRNVPSSKAAIFELNLGNETELLPSKASDEIEYQLSVDPASNPDGLVVLLNGENLVKPVPISIPFGQRMRQTLTVFRGPKLYNYKDLTLKFESPCDTTIHKEIKMDIDYIPVCAEAAIASPGNNWTVNYDSTNKLALKVGSYDVNYQGFKGIKIQYKRSNESETSWKLLETYYRDADARTRAITDLQEDDINAPLLLGNDFTYYWDVSRLNDDLYDVRIQSMCQGDGQDVIYTSPTISGIIDRVNPSSFGAPQPSDGVLSAGDEIMIQFNEPINAGLLNAKNFDIRGVVQGGDLKHPASVYFNGANDYMEIPAGIQLNRRSFSFDFYAKRKKQGTEILLSQGTTTAQSFSAGFNAANQFEVVLAGVKINSTKTIPADDTWVHYAYAYDAAIQEAKLVINGVLDVNKPAYAPNYEATGKILVGKDGLSQSPSFQGNIHELRFWGKALTVAQINVAATKRLKNNEPGLLGNWPMEETEGVLAKDIVRARHAQIISGTWQVALTGNALATNATASPTIKSPAYLDVSNFSIEFWFKGNGTSQATLLSNGRGDDQDLNKNGWSVRANASGLLEVWNNNKVFNATANNYFDNQWHHFALVVNRLTNTVCFVDGNQQNSTESQTLGFTGFGGAALHLGAMGWVNPFGVTQQTQPFTGALDEVRVWQGARNALQIKRDMRYMLSGDEAGLDLYLPFDKYETNMGIETLVASKTSAATGDTAVKTSGVGADVIGTIAYMQDTPLVKLPRPVRKVNFSYSANQDKIILTTADADSVLENVILDVSVTGVQDLNGNIMRAPVTWTAYVDKNQVVWTESDKNFKIEMGKGLTFTTRIENTGGKVFNFNINNLPSWLTASPSSGTIGPKSSMPVTFTVDKDVNIGNYVQDILLETEFGFAEVMNLSLDVFKPLPADWTVSPSEYQYSMNFIAQLSINGDISRDPNDQVAAFVGDECRGIAKLKYIESIDSYEAFISVYSNKTSGEAIQFRIWNASDGQVHRDVTPTYLFESNEVLGTAIKPEILKAVDVLEHTYNLPKGWTWISSHLNYNYNPNKQLTTTDLLKPINAVNGDLIRTIDAFDSYDSVAGWAGTISAKGGVKNGRGYKVFVANANQLKYNGLLLKGDQVKIDVVKGWNWIGYIGFKNMPINQALAGFTNVSEGDVIKNQYNLAIYSQNVGWIGDLTNLKPGEGYMMKTAQEGSFHYPNLSYTASGNKFAPNKSTVQSSILEASSKYPNTMNAVAEVVGDNQSIHNRLRAFVGKELRGESVPVFNPITNKSSYFVTIYGQTTPEDVRFEFIDTQENVSSVNETFPFAKDVVVGELKRPTVLTLKGTLGVNQEQIKLLQVFPNPFTDVLNIDLFAGHKVVKIILTDMQGRRIRTSKVSSQLLNIVLDVQNVSNGIYILSFYDADGNIVETQRVIK
jgi:hypothetical protein